MHSAPEQPSVARVERWAGTPVTSCPSQSRVISTKPRSGGRPDCGALGTISASRRCCEISLREAVRHLARRGDTCLDARFADRRRPTADDAPPLPRLAGPSPPSPLEPTRAGSSRPWLALARPQDARERIFAGDDATRQMAINDLSPGMLWGILCVIHPDSMAKVRSPGLRSASSWGRESIGACGTRPAAYGGGPSAGGRSAARQEAPDRRHEIRRVRHCRAVRRGVVFASADLARVRKQAFWAVAEGLGGRVRRRPGPPAPSMIKRRARCATRGASPTPVDPTSRETQQ